MKFDLYASQPHYADHLVPIWRALPDELRGDAWAGNGSCWWGGQLPARYRPTDRVVLVAGFVDVQRLGHVRTVYVEHGAGQSYHGDGRQVSGSYSGGRHPDSVVGYVAPGGHVAEAWAQARPGVPVCVAGCPRLDPWLTGERGVPLGRTVAVTFHWNCHVAPETRSALGHYRPQLARILAGWRAQGFTVLGHGHPRAWGVMDGLWRSLGVETVQDSGEVLDRAGVLVADNTSLLYEAAALDRPVVVLNAPWYRRDVNHGLRFWDLIPGRQVNDADELARLDLADLVDTDPLAAWRRQVAGQVYAHLDGQSARRAADWLTGLAWTQEV